ncbi:hypothetical protein H5410_050413, partial [Solanum commersonii]
MAQNCLTLVETLMDKMFPCIVGNTSTIDMISIGLGENKGAALLLIKTELHLISDLVPFREIKFLRYCNKHVDGLWVVVDVIWIEHIEYNENHVNHLYHSLVKKSLGLVHKVGSKDEICMWMLAQRMTHNFCAGVCATTHKWKVIQLENGEYPKLMTRTNTGHMSEPIGAVGDNNSAKQNNMLIFQDDAIGSLLVYGIVNSQEINMMMKGGGGFFICSSLGQSDNGNGIFGKNDNGVYSGSLVTIGFQMMDNSLLATNLHMESIKNANDIISYTIHKIKTALKCKFLSLAGDAFSLSKLCSLQQIFYYSELAASVTVGDVSGEPHFQMPIVGVGLHLRLAFAPVEPKEFGELYFCKLFCTSSTIHAAT